jgi:periplasmic protein TonB
MSRLTAFFLASLCVHAGLMTALTWKPTPRLSSAAPILSVRLSYTESDTHREATPRPVVVSKHPETTVRRRVAQRLALAPSLSTAKPPPAITPTVESPPLVTTDETPAVTADSVGSPVRKTVDTAEASTAIREATRVQIRALILTDLARRFTYPPLAQRRGWQGEVLVSVTVAPTGTLNHVRVTQSSGYDILDRAAVNTIRNVGRLTDARSWLRGQSFELLLPVVYRLTD